MNRLTFKTNLNTQDWDSTGDIPEKVEGYQLNEFFGGSKSRYLRGVFITHLPSGRLLVGRGFETAHGAKMIADTVVGLMGPKFWNTPLPVTGSVTPRMTEFMDTIKFAIPSDDPIQQEQAWGWLASVVEGHSRASKALHNRGRDEEG